MHQESDSAYRPCKYCQMRSKTISKTEGATLVKCSSCQRVLDILNLNLSYRMKIGPTLF